MNEKQEIRLTEAPLREAKEQLCPDTAYLIGDDEIEEPMLVMFYKEAA